MSEALLCVEHLKKRFGDFTAVYDISFTVPKGSIYALLGPNGAGKTTTLRMILGIITPTAGRVLVDGHDVHKQPEIAKAKIGYMPQQHSLYEDLTVWENLEFYASMYRVVKDQAKLRDILEFVELYDVRHRLVGHLSGGMKQRASLACALVHDPPLLVLDEPTAGVDPVVRRRMWAYFKELKDRGRAILVTTHYMDEVVHAETIHLMRRGKTIMKGSMEEIIEAMGAKPIYTILAQVKSKEALREIQKTLNAKIRKKKDLWAVELTQPNDLQSILELMEKKGAKVRDIRTHFPTLEDAFVYFSEKTEGNG